MWLPISLNLHTDLSYLGHYKVVAHPQQLGAIENKVG